MIFDKDDLVDILPEKPYVMGHEEAIHSVVFIPLVIIDGESYILLEERAPHIRQGSEISFPGGKVDSEDINYEYTAIRETIEELGVNKNQIEIIGQMDSIIGPSEIYVHCYLGILDISSLEDCCYNRDEVTSLFLMPIKYLLENEPDVNYIDVTHHWSQSQNQGDLNIGIDMKLPQKYHQPWSSGKRKIYIYQYDGHVIWGITARFLYDLAQRIRMSNTIEKD